VEVTPVEDLTPEEILDNMIENQTRKEKRALKKKREEAKKRQIRITRGMIQDGDEWDFDRDHELFDLEAAMNAGELGAMPDYDSEDDMDHAGKEKRSRQEEDLNFSEVVEKYLEVAHQKSKRQKVRIKGKLVAVVDDQEHEEEEEVAKELRSKQYLTRMGPGTDAEWFSQEMFAGVDTGIIDEENNVIDFEDDEHGHLAMEIEQEVVPKGDDVEEEEEKSASEEEEAPPGAMHDASNAERLRVLKMGRELLSGDGKNLKEMVDDSFNKWGNKVDDNSHLPDWFTEKEAEYWGPFKKPEEFDEKDLKRVAGIANKPIKKIVEAKARTKRKVANHMKRVEPKVMAIANNSEMGQAERVKAISKLYKGVRPKDRGRVYMVSNKKAQINKVRTAKGKKRGAVRMVDKRLKADKSLKQKKAEGARSKRHIKKRG
jgi:AdoMet-dependent rRNA methyltransferase SPB1